MVAKTDQVPPISIIVRAHVIDPPPAPASATAGAASPSSAAVAAVAARARNSKSDQPKSGSLHQHLVTKVAPSVAPFSAAMVVAVGSSSSSSVDPLIASLEQTQIGEGRRRSGVSTDSKGSIPPSAETAWRMLSNALSQELQEAQAALNAFEAICKIDTDKITPKKKEALWKAKKFGYSLQGKLERLQTQFNQLLSIQQKELREEFQLKEKQIKKQCFLIDTAADNFLKKVCEQLKQGYLFLGEPERDKIIQAMIHFQMYLHGFGNLTGEAATTKRRVFLNEVSSYAWPTYHLQSGANAITRQKVFLEELYNDLMLPDGEDKESFNNWVKNPVMVTRFSQQTAAEPIAQMTLFQLSYLLKTPFGQVTKKGSTIIIEALSKDDNQKFDGMLPSKDSRERRGALECAPASRVSTSTTAAESGAISTVAQEETTKPKLKVLLGFIQTLLGQSSLSADQMGKKIESLMWPMQMANTSAILDPLFLILKFLTPQATKVASALICSQMNKGQKPLMINGAQKQFEVEKVEQASIMKISKVKNENAVIVSHKFSMPIHLVRVGQERERHVANFDVRLKFKVNLQTGNTEVLIKRCGAVTWIAPQVGTADLEDLHKLALLRIIREDLL